MALLAAALMLASCGSKPPPPLRLGLECHGPSVEAAELTVYGFLLSHYYPGYPIVLDVATSAPRHRTAEWLRKFPGIPYLTDNTPAAPGTPSGQLEGWALAAADFDHKNVTDGCIDRLPEFSPSGANTGWQGDRITFSRVGFARTGEVIVEVNLSRGSLSLLNEVRCLRIENGKVRFDDYDGYGYVIEH